MQSQNVLFDQIYDLVAFRIVVDSVRECYEALGVVHASWKPVPGRFKDFIALPKANMYQSLHTTVIGPYGERMEVQIRTHEMHRVAEEGIAAHWRYKDGTADGDDTQRFAWLRQLLEWQQNVQDPQEFLGSVKEDLFSDEVFVFTPKGDLLNFPEGATVVDFAYRIHSEVGHHCAGARVNGRLVPLRYRLRNGDTVEIVTTASQTPSKDWLKFVKTSRAKSRIRNWIKYQQHTRSVALGRELLERDLGRYHLDLTKLRKDQQMHSLLAGLGDARRGLAAGRRRLRPDHHPQVLARLLPAEQLDDGRAREEGALRRLFRMVSRQNKAGVPSAASTTCWFASASAAIRCPASASSASSRSAAVSPCTPSTARASWRAIRSAASRWCGRTAPTTCDRCASRWSASTSRGSWRASARRSARWASTSAAPRCAACPTRRP